MVPELNTTSTADISFMLLTFFLVTTSMDVDRGIVRQLPPLDTEQKDVQEVTNVSRDNTLAFHLTASGELLKDDKPVSTEGLRNDIATFILGRMKQHIILVDADPASGYNAYFQLQDEIVAAYRIVRDRIAHKQYHKPYATLTDEQRQHVRDLCPQRISETYNTSESQDATTKGGKQ